MNLRDRVKRVLEHLRGSLKPEGTMAFPTPTAQHYQETEDQKFRREHGYSKATTPMPWGEDISKHNAEVQAEYAEEVERRKLAFANGEYMPRFFMDSQVNPGVYDDVNWDLEMSLRPGARLDVTKETPNLPLLTWDEQAQAQEIGRLSRAVAAVETDPITKYVGTREEVLRACDGDEEKADQVFAKARALFGLPTEADQPIIYKRAILTDDPPTEAQQAMDKALVGVVDSGDGYLRDKDGKIIGITDCF